QRVMDITDGKGVPVVYDSIGKDTFQASIDSLSPFGLFVSFGNASGPVPPVPLTALKGNLYMCRPSLMAHSSNRATLEAMSARLFDMVSSGKVSIEIDQRYALKDAAQSHRDLEARKTTGSTILLP
ncbi:MAG: quinone oxidoreductase, partial [Betaproteobacteria bacterium]|nr:quinone oxidoreductase [Betaproteobacteria bacterium]